MAKRTRPKQVKFWATEEELSIIKEKSLKSQLTQQEYLLRTALEKNILVIDGIKELIIELTKQGNNLRLIANNLEGENIEKIQEASENLMRLWEEVDRCLKEGKK